jgi:hypothetical protein
MARSDKSPSETEAILIALDQLNQTIDVMSSVVGRLRNHMQQREAAASDQTKDLQIDMQSDRILH